METQHTQLQAQRQKHLLMISNDDKEVLILHKHPHLMDSCCDLLNAEWKRSKTARLRSLEASCDAFPTCLVLVHKSGDGIAVIGHSKISLIPSVPSGCFVESVVIHQTWRGKGLGRYLMNETENYAKCCGFRTMYLSTHDQQGFYGRLGYTECQPVSIYGCSTFLGYNESASSEESEGEASMSLPVKALAKQAEAMQISSDSSPMVPAPPPPPPPPPQKQRPITSYITAKIRQNMKPTVPIPMNNFKKVFMNKDISS